MDAAKYAALFLTESREHLRTCNRLLLEWEREPAAAEPVAGLFRAIHTIKGMAATMGYAGVAELAHGTETLLDALRAGRVAASPVAIQVLFRAVDAIGAGAERAAAGVEEPADPILLHDLATAAVGSSAEPTVEPRPSRRGAQSARGRRATDAGRVRAVRVTIRPDAVMRGARALLALRRAEELGTAAAVRPPVGQFDRPDFDGAFGLRLETRESDERVAAAIRAAGEVEDVEVGDPMAPTLPADGTAGVRHIRVELRRLDNLMKQVGELVVARNRLVALAGGAPGSELEELAGRIARLVGQVQGEVIAARMTPVGEVFERFPRLVRDLARELGKEIRCEMEGEAIELDRSILDEVGEPLLHLVRNAADHGIELPAARVEARKPAEGRILVAAARERNVVALRVSDDGRGIDRDAILAKAKRDGVVDGAAERLTDDQLLRVLARPGFSTAHQVSGVSGRGVGVDVALTRVRAIGGTLEIQSQPGRGTTFTIRVPLTLAIVRALLAEAGGERYAVPLAYVAETVEFDPAAVTAVRDREAVVVRDRVIPTVHLRDLVAARRGTVPLRRPTVILEVGERRAALVVDALVGQQDIVVEPFDAPNGVPPYVGGATILADGAPALILDAAALA